MGSSRRIVPGGVSERSFGSVLALCVSRARCEELATRSLTGDGGTGGSSLGLGGDGATAAWRARPVDRPTADAADAGAGLFGISMSESKRDDVRRTSPWTIHALAIAQPGTRLPFRGATSSAGRSGCCAVLRVLVAGERCRGRPGRGWGSVGGLVPSQGQCGLPACASGASFWSWYPWMGCLLLAGPKFWVPGAFSAPQSAPLTQSSPRKLTSAPRALSLTTTLYAAQRPPSCREYVSRLVPASL